MIEQNRVLFIEQNRFFFSLRGIAHIFTKKTSSGGCYSDLNFPSGQNAGKACGRRITLSYCNINTPGLAHQDNYMSSRHLEMPKRKSMSFIRLCVGPSFLHATVTNVDMGSSNQIAHVMMSRHQF